MKTKALLGIVASIALLAGNAVGQSVSTVTTNTLFGPHSVVVNEGIFYISDGNNNRIVKHDPSTGATELVAGSPDGLQGENNGPSFTASFFNPQGLVAARGGLVVADSGNHAIRFVSFDGLTVSNLAGIPNRNFQGLVNGAAAGARFNIPIGLATDADGTIYIADSQNNVIRKLDTNNMVTTFATGFYQPNGLAVGDNGELWVADTRNHQIKVVDTNGLVSIRAGSGLQGFLDANGGLTARFSNPRSVLWMGAGAGLLVSDSGNNVIRRVFTNSTFGGYTVALAAGVPGQSGFVDGVTNVAKFNAPKGLARDAVNGGFLVVDSANNAVRRIQLSPVQPPITDPKIGFVVIDAITGKTVLIPVTQSVFNNDVIIAILSEKQGVETFYSLGSTPTNAFIDTVPDPTAATGSAPQYQDGASSLPLPFISPQPDLTIKAVSSQDGRIPSKIVKARFQFKTASPLILGNNAAAFSVTNSTFGTAFYYTIDGSDPTNGPPSLGPIAAGDTVSLNLNNSNLLFKIIGFKQNYQPSQIISTIFSPTNFIANQISLGFASGEASSDYIAAPGQKYYVPITLSLLDGQTIESLGFTIGITNISGPAIAPGAYSFNSTLIKTIDNVNYYITNGFFTGFSTNVTSVVVTNVVETNVFYVTNIVASYTNGLFTTTSNNLLGVAWLETHGSKALYDTSVQDLVSKSQPNITLFTKPKVVAGGYWFQVPNAPLGSKYRVQVFNASGAHTYDQGVNIFAPTNGTLGPGTLNSVKEITVGIRQYLVGDVSNFRWFNAGEFGNGTLDINDANQTFQAAIYGVFVPLEFSDLFDAMDSSDGAINPGLNASSGDIDGVPYGDGQLNVDDVFVTLRRALDPYSKWYVRFWQAGVLNSIEATNNLTKPNYGLPQAPATTFSLNAPAGGSLPSISFSAGDSSGTGGTITVPIKVKVQGDYPAKILMMGLRVHPVDDSPRLTVPVQFVISPEAQAALGAPTFTKATGNIGYGAAWLNINSPGFANGEYLLGTLTVTLPPNAPITAAYTVEFDHASASPNGTGLLPKKLIKGLITLADRSNSSRNDGIPDAWRLRFFRSLGAIFAGLNNTDITGATADADGDGIPNWAEYKAGTDPNDATSTVKLGTKATSEGVSFTLDTVAGKVYVVEAAPTLGGPWTAVSGNITSTGEPIEFKDTNPGNGLKFYRVRLVEQP